MYANYRITRYNILGILVTDTFSNLRCSVNPGKSHFFFPMRRETIFCICAAKASREKVCFINKKY